MKVETRCTALEKLPDGSKNAYFTAADAALPAFTIRLPPERAGAYKLGDLATFEVTLSLS